MSCWASGPRSCHCGPRTSWRAPRSRSPRSCTPQNWRPPGPCGCGVPSRYSSHPLVSAFLTTSCQALLTRLSLAAASGIRATHKISSRRPAVPGLIDDVTLDDVEQRLHPLGELGHRLVQPLPVPFAPLYVLLQAIQALISPRGEQASAFREFPHQCFKVRGVASQPRNLRVILGLAFEHELNSSLEF